MLIAETSGEVLTAKATLHRETVTFLPAVGDIDENLGHRTVKVRK